MTTLYKILIILNFILIAWQSAARWLSWLKRLTSNEEIPSSNLGRAFLFMITFFKGYLLDYNRKYLIRDGDLKNTGIVSNEDGTRRSSRSSTVIQV